MNKYKPVGWRHESHRHYLAAKGIKTLKYNSSKRSRVARERLARRFELTDPDLMSVTREGKVVDLGELSESLTDAESRHVLKGSVPFSFDAQMAANDNRKVPVKDREAIRRVKKAAFDEDVDPWNSEVLSDIEFPEEVLGTKRKEFEEKKDKRKMNREFAREDEERIRRASASSMDRGVSRQSLGDYWTQESFFAKKVATSPEEVGRAFDQEMKKITNFSVPEEEVDIALYLRKQRASQDFGEDIEDIRVDRDRLRNEITLKKKANLALDNAFKKGKISEQQREVFPLFPEEE